MNTVREVLSFTEGVENPYQFNTKYTDAETGLVYYGFRFYDAKDGRWLNQDPIGVNGGINLYNSVSNNMVNGFAGGERWSGGMRILSEGDFTSGFGLDSLGLEVIFVEAGGKKTTRNDNNFWAVNFVANLNNYMDKKIKILKKFYAAGKLDDMEFIFNGKKFTFNKYIKKIESLKARKIVLRNGIKELNRIILGLKKDDYLVVSTHTSVITQNNTQKVMRKTVQLGDVAVPLPILTGNIERFNNKTISFSLVSCTINAKEAKELLDKTGLNSLLYSSSAGQQFEPRLKIHTSSKKKTSKATFRIKTDLKKASLQ